MADFTYEAFAQGEIARLEDRRLAAREERLDAELELGRSADVVGELESLVEQNPLRERLRGQLMLALYRSGRQAEALQAYQEARRTLVDELGIEPSPALQQLHASILRQESTLQPAAMPNAGQDRLGEVVRALLSGRLVPVLGPSPPSQPGNELHAQLARAFDCPEEHRGDLSRVSQYIAVTHGVGPLYDELHELFAAEAEPGPVERFLARFPVAARAHGVDHPLVVTTGYGLGLELAFEEAGEEFDVVSYVAIGRDRGKFVHRRPDGSETVISVPNSYADLSLAARPVVMKIHGEVDIRADRGRESSSSARTTTSATWLGPSWQTSSPSPWPRSCAAAIFCLFAYPVVEWSLRVFLHRVFGDRRSATGRGLFSPVRSRSNESSGAMGGGSLRRVSRCLRRRPRAAPGRRRARVIATKPRSPYKGLVPFGDSKLDALLFFGREREGQIIGANVLAARLTVLYGPSGVGKTSSPRAGVAYRLRELALGNIEQRGHPEFAVVVFDAWSDEPISGIRQAVHEELSGLFGSALLDEREGESLADTLGRWTDALACDVLLVLDQAEEYFLYHSEESGFADELPELVTRPGLRVRVLLSLRDDALAKLDRFKGRIPSLFANYLRLDHLDRRSARDAIVKPVERFNDAEKGEPVEIEPALIEAVLTQTAAGKVDLSEGGRGLGPGETDESRIEAPYLQLVMERVWEEEGAQGSRVLRARDAGAPRRRSGDRSDASAPRGGGALVGGARCCGRRLPIPGHALRDEDRARRRRPR